MYNANMIVSNSLEKHVLGGLIRHQEVWPEVAPFLEEADFAYDINKVIFLLVSSAYNKSEAIDQGLLTERLRNTGMSFRDNIDPPDYVTGLALVQTSAKTTMQAIKDLKSVTKRRECSEVCDQIKRKMVGDAANMEYDDIVAYVDREFYQKMNSWYDTGDSIDLFETMFERAFERGENPIEEVGFPTPYPMFNEKYGGLLPGNVYVFCSRPKQGKTSFLNSTAFHMANTMGNIPCLILDTEMQEDEIGDRLLSMISHVSNWHIKTGQWNRNEEMAKRVLDAYEQHKKARFSLHHEYVINCPVHHVVNKIKRWYYTKVGRGNPCIIVYDYIKLTGESLSGHYREYQAIGDKVNTLKELVGKEINAPLLTALQLNRSGEDARSDDATAISLSDRALWFASYVGIFRRKTLEEISEEPVNHGSHKLITVESRWQGRSSFGHHDRVKHPDTGRYVNDFLNFDVEDFGATEISDARTMFQDYELAGSVATKQEADDPFER